MSLSCSMSSTGKRRLSAHRRPSAPAIAPKREVNADASLSIKFNTGWTWFSLSVLVQDMSIQKVFENATFTEGDIIKGQDKFAEYYDEFGWFGTLTHLSPYDMFKSKLANGFDMPIFDLQKSNFLPKESLTRAGTGLVSFQEHP